MTVQGKRERAVVCHMFNECDNYLGCPLQTTFIRRLDDDESGSEWCTTLSQQFSGRNPDEHTVSVVSPLSFSFA